MYLIKLIKPVVLFFVLFCAASGLYSQVDSASSVGSSKFKINGSKKFWMGNNYRKEWTTPIKAPVINLNTENGGLTPVKRGGGKQTKSLRVEDPSGRQYTFRSIEKFITSKTLPADLQSQAAEDLVADGVSASFPYSTLSIPPIADAAGVPYGKVKLVYIPDDPKLGEHRKDFANTLALFEARLPESVEKAYDSDDVVKKLKEDNDDDIDQHAVLTARILDMFVMDLDRHEDQWQWGARDKSKGKTYFPIPRDRDQAFYTNQGLIPGMVKWPWIVPQLEGFKPKAKSINRFNFAARNFDRFFLNELSKEEWKKTVDAFLPKMTDAVIDDAFSRQPAEIKDISGAKLNSQLKERRKFLADEVMEYYRFLAEIVSVSGSDKKELFDINIASDGKVHVQVYKVNKEGEQSAKMYDRVFDPTDTKEIRLYAFGGEDKFNIKGSDSKIKIRMIGGEGTDNFENTSGDKAIVYDMKNENNKLSGKLSNKMANDTLVNSYNRLEYKYNQTIPMISATYNSDDGVLLGFKLKFINHGFRKTPYRNMHDISANHSLRTKAFNFRYYAEFIGAFGRKTDLITDFDLKGRNNITSFYGYGDESVYDKSKPNEFRYYWAKYNTGDVGIFLRKRFSDKVMMVVGPAFQYFHLDSTDNKNKYILQTGLNGLDPSTLFAKQSYIGGKYTLIADTRNNKALPTRGIYWQTTARHLEGLTDKSYSFTQLNSDFTFHLPISSKTLVLVNRTGGGHNFGDFEFYQAQYIGGEDNLRGYRKYRFAGRSKFYNNTELRWRVATFRTYLFPAYFGFMAFYDTGKIWDDSHASDKWLSGYGGGIWIAPLTRLILTGCYAASKEDKLLLVTLGWRF